MAILYGKNTSNFCVDYIIFFCVCRKTLTFFVWQFLCVRIHSNFLYGKNT